MGVCVRSVGGTAAFALAGVSALHVHIYIYICLLLSHGSTSRRRLATVGHLPRTTGRRYWLGKLPGPGLAFHLVAAFLPSSHGPRKPVVATIKHMQLELRVPTAPLRRRTSLPRCPARRVLMPWGFRQPWICIPADFCWSVRHQLTVCLLVMDCLAQTGRTCITLPSPPPASKYDKKRPGNTSTPGIRMRMPRLRSDGCPGPPASASRALLGHVRNQMLCGTCSSSGSPAKHTRF